MPRNHDDFRECTRTYEDHGKKHSSTRTVMELGCVRVVERKNHSHTFQDHPAWVSDGSPQVV